MLHACMDRHWLNMGIHGDEIHWTYKAKPLLSLVNTTFVSLCGYMHACLRNFSYFFLPTQQRTVTWIGKGWESIAAMKWARQCPPWLGFTIFQCMHDPKHWASCILLKTYISDFFLLPPFTLSSNLGRHYPSSK